MPQGTVVAIKPQSFAANDGSTEEKLHQTRQGGEVQILNGKYAGQLASFDEEGESSLKSVGDKVKVKIIDTADGNLQAKLC
ncbi:hypothetical protein ACFS7Z_03610 [Pontibacter toksunensis]|uniref:TRAM domain-containing protein n=1 Tax=Pontibacter toksunensis TaxID=1332631 RepID=A0ABW6BQN3_9BACT